VVTPAPGIVVGVGYGHQFGTYVRILHEHVGLETILAHLSAAEPGLRRGTRVRRGQLVGHSGNSGLSTGPHLHYEFRTVWGQRPVDPLQVYSLYFNALDRVAGFPVAAAHASQPPYRIVGVLRTGDRVLPALTQKPL
jgi:murein DD-endopeptidase MepM/ murein hydrolase activator NlpD